MTVEQGDAILSELAELRALSNYVTEYLHYIQILLAVMLTALAIYVTYRFSSFVVHQIKDLMMNLIMKIFDI